MASSRVSVSERTEFSGAIALKPFAKLSHIIAVACLTLVTRVGIYLAISSHWKFEQLLPWDGWGRIALFMSKGYGLSDTYLMTYFPLGSTPVPTASRPPIPVILFAGVLKIFGEELLPVIITQALLEAGTAVLIYIIVRKLFERGAFGSLAANESVAKGTAILAAVGFAFFMPEWPYAIGFQSEPVYTLLLTAAMALAILKDSRRALVFSGILFGLAALARPSIVLFPAMLLPWLIWGRRISWKHTVLLPVMTVVMLIPWGVRNYMVFHHAIFTETLAGYNLYRNSTQIENDNYIRFVSGEEGNPKILKLLESKGLSPQTISEPDLDKLLRTEAIKVILAHPGRYINLCAHRVLWLFYDSDAGKEFSPKLPLVYFAFTFTLLLLTAAALIKYRGPWIKQFMPLWMLFIYILPVHALIVSQVRYFLPLVPLFLCVAAYGTARAYLEIRTSLSSRANGTA